MQSQRQPSWSLLDAAFTGFLDDHPDHDQRWLLAQTVATAGQRRALLGMLDVQAGWSILDVGTGFGPLPMELAALAPVDAVGIDVDGTVLAAASTLAATVEAAGGFCPGSRIEFTEGSVYRLTAADGSVDLATARFVFQHLDDPTTAAAELGRVVRPGGLVCVMDVDDGLSLSHPPPSAAYVRLAAAVSALQGNAGGTRIGARTLPALFDGAGFDIVSLVVLPQAAYGPSRPGDLSRRLLVARFTELRPALVDGGLIGNDEFDACLGVFAGEEVDGVCTIEGHLAVVGRRR